MRILIYILSLLLFCNLNAQVNEQIETKKTDLKDLQGKIKNLENDLSKTEVEEQKTVQSLSKMTQQQHYLNKLINELKIKEKSKSKKIDELTGDINHYEAEMDTLKNNYTDYVIWLYKNRKKTGVKLLITSDSFLEGFKRYKYFSYINKYCNNRFTELKNTVEKFMLVKNEYEKEKKEYSRLVNLKTKESERLKVKKEERKKLLADLSKDVENIKEEIEQKRLTEIKIQDLIEELEKKERERLAKLQESKLKKGNAPVPNPFDYGSLSNFSELKGKLSWPVKGRVVRNFGEVRNKKLNTKTWNFGVDIEVRKNEFVKAVNDGYVSAIQWIPGFGSVLIVSHKNGYRTVYGHVANISVVEGQKIEAGAILGEVENSLEGKLLHFEIWNERNYQNPINWLSRK